MKAALTKFGYLVTGPPDEAVFVADKNQLADVKMALCARSGLDPDDYSTMEVFIKGWTFDSAHDLKARLNQIPGMAKRDWDQTYKEQVMQEAAEVDNGFNKLIMDWGYRHNLMLTQAQIDDLKTTMIQQNTTVAV